MNQAILLSKAFDKILFTFKQTNKLKKVSYSVKRKRYCYKGKIENGILRTYLINITEQKHDRLRIY